MPKKRHSAEEIIGKLREVEVLVGRSGSLGEAIRSVGVTEQTYYRWRKEYAGLRLDQAKRLWELERENAAAQSGRRSDLGQAHPVGGCQGKLLSPARRRAAIEHVRLLYPISERRACSVLRQHRSTQRKASRTGDDEAALTADIVELAKRHGRYGYRRITALLRDAGWSVNHKWVERIWRREGLKVPAKQPRRRCLWLADGSCIWLRPQHPGHVWAYDFVEDRTHDGRKLRILTVIDEYTRECQAPPVGRQLRGDDVLATLTELFVAHGPPEHIRSDQGSEFTANVVKD
jgi:hypothetical protein